MNRASSEILFWLLVMGSLEIKIFRRRSEKDSKQYFRAVSCPETPMHAGQEYCKVISLIELILEEQQ